MSRPIGSSDSCGKCGQPHPRCTGHATDGDTGVSRPCRKWPRKGQRVCETHGGNSPQALIAAERRKAEADAAGLLDTIGPIEGVIVRDVFTRLLALAGQIDAWTTILAVRVAKLQSIGDAEGRVRPEIKVFENAQRLLADLLVAIGRLDLDERIARLDRADAQNVADFVDRVLTTAGFTPALQHTFWDVWARLAAELPEGD